MSEMQKDEGDQTLDPSQYGNVLEALIFVSDEPVPARVLARTLGIKTKDVHPVLSELREMWQNRGINLIESAGGYIFQTHATAAPYVKKLIAKKPVRLSRAQLETLAIVAYRQPVTRPEIEDIRGVDPGSALRLLTDRELVKILGRKDEPGRPILYGTDKAFLELFGLKNLEDLPTLREFAELSDESQKLFEETIGGPLNLSEVEEAAMAAEEEALRDLIDEDDGEEDASDPQEDDSEGQMGQAPANPKSDDNKEDADT